MSLNGTTNEERIWNYLKARGLSDCGVGGLMGNLYAESGLNPINLQNYYEKKLGMSDAEYTQVVDKGTYTNFAKDGAGYGLCQWTYWTRKQGLLDHAKAAGKSVGDTETQLSFLMKELRESYRKVLTTLKTAVSIAAASDCVLLQFERPKDQSEAAKERRRRYAQTFYDKFSENGGVAMTENELRVNVVSIAQSYLGCKERDGSHKKIIDLYNSHKPLARGYKVQYTDPWCATFVSAVAIRAGLTSIMPTECSCSKMIALYKNLGRWEENDAYVPQTGDLVMYDWDDAGRGDCPGAPEHVGIVVSVSGKALKIIEGNKNNAVGYRTMQVNGRYIRGYCLPDYTSLATPVGNQLGMGYTMDGFHKAAMGGVSISVPASKPVVTTDKSSAASTGSAMPTTFQSYRVRVKATNLNIRTGAGTNTASKGYIKPGVYTIVAESNGPGASKWGKLKSIAGWVSLDYCQKLS